MELSWVNRLNRWFMIVCLDAFLVFTHFFFLSFGSHSSLIALHDGICVYVWVFLCLSPCFYLQKAAGVFLTPSPTIIYSTWQGVLRFWYSGRPRYELNPFHNRTRVWIEFSPVKLTNHPARNILLISLTFKMQKHRYIYIVCPCQWFLIIFSTSIKMLFRNW